jgi:ABC-type dipeptide/oligopeptide/nickel transport system ATPase component
MSLLEIKNLTLEFDSGVRTLRALDDVSLSIEAGETVCLVGESGSGKSVTALSIARLLPSPPVRYAGGTILLEGRDVLTIRKSELRRIRGGVVSYIFQDPSALLILSLGSAPRSRRRSGYTGLRPPPTRR